MNIHRCDNCKFKKHDYYDGSTCMSPDVFDIDSNGIFIKKIHPKLHMVIPDDSSEPCEYFKPSKAFLIKKYFGNIQKRYYKFKHPE